MDGSRPARGAWIEIVKSHTAHHAVLGRAPHGARGLKLSAMSVMLSSISRAPHGARGLKFFEVEVQLFISEVAPRTGRVD